MKIHQVRNATALLTLGEHRLLIDPMLSEKGAMPGFKLMGGGRRPNPIVPLPPHAEEVFSQATGILLTHRHPDHFDTAAIRWIRKCQLPVWTNPKDAPKLKKKGLDARILQSTSLGMQTETIPVRHGRGFVGWIAGAVSSYYLAHPGEPTLYMTGDAVLTEDLLRHVKRLRPDVILAPAGAANFGFGSNLIFSVDELITLIQSTPSRFVFNHLEALDHCPTKRTDLRKRLDKEGLAHRVAIPEDGESWTFSDNQ